MKWLMVPGMLLALSSVAGACADDQGAGLTSVSESRGDPTSGPPREPDAADGPGAAGTGPVPEGGAAGCVERYSPAAVAGRAFAFDGVVTGIGPAVSDRGDGSDLGLAGVTFDVAEWFAGGSHARVTVDMAAPVEGAGESSEAGPSYAVGSRLLVSGEPRWGGPPLEDPIAWGCGFTRYYDSATAKSWKQELAGQR